MKNNNKNILFLTTFYPNSLRAGTPVCHYFAREWVKMGYNVVVVHYRSMFPPLYTFMAKLFPKLALRYVGNRVEMDRNMDIVQEMYEGIPVYSVPIFKYIPHGKYSKSTINKQLKIIDKILVERQFKPDAIIGHFYNPNLVIVSRLKKKYPNARTCVSLHEPYADAIMKVYKHEYKEIFSGIDVMGYRSVPIKRHFESLFGKPPASLLCPSGTPVEYTSKPLPKDKGFSNESLNKFIYVGQFIQRKNPCAVAEALNEVYGNENFHLNYIGKKEILFSELKQFVNDNHLEDKVTFVGKVPREQIIDYYDEAQCFVMISTYEVFGLVYLEAMSRGCIAIASKDEGMDGIIIDGENGFLCEAGNVEELKQIISRINALTKEEKERISKNAVQTARILNDHDVAVSYIDNVFDPGCHDLIKN